jgi:hypothetical protein
MTRQPRPVFIIKLRPVRADCDGIRGLRAILKSLLRRYGFRCIDAREQQSSTSETGVSDGYSEAETRSRQPGYR